MFDGSRESCLFSEAVPERALLLYQATYKASKAEHSDFRTRCNAQIDCMYDDCRIVIAVYPLPGTATDSFANILLSSVRL